MNYSFTELKSFSSSAKIDILLIINPTKLTIFFMKFLSVLYLSLLFVSFIGCDNSQKQIKEENVIEEKVMNNNSNNKSNNISQFEFSEKVDAKSSELVMANQLMIETQFGNRVNPETFKTVIPSAFIEYKGNVPSIGTLNYSGYSVTSLNNSYKGDRGFYKLVIQDFGDKIEFPEKKQFEELPEITGMVVEKVQIENGKAYLIWDNGNNTGFLNALVYERFIVKIDATNVLYKKESLIKFYDKIKLKYIREITLKDKIKK